MEAGKELDALVAEKVMGWEYVPPDDLYKEYWLVPGGPRDDSVKESPHFSTDIAAAWQVVEKYEICELEKWDKDLGDRWTCAFNIDQGFATADTAPLAICLAALKAVGVEVPA